MGSSNISRRWPAQPGLGQEACAREMALWGHYPPGELCWGQGIWKAGLSQAEKGGGKEAGPRSCRALGPTLWSLDQLKGDGKSPKGVGISEVREFWKPPRLSQAKTQGSFLWIILGSPREASPQKEGCLSHPASHCIGTWHMVGGPWAMPFREVVSLGAKSKDLGIRRNWFHSVNLFAHRKVESLSPFS